MKRHLILLTLAAVVLDGQDERKVGREKCVRLDGVVQDLGKVNFCGQRPTVMDDRFVVGPVPAICNRGQCFNGLTPASFRLFFVLSRYNFTEKRQWESQIDFKSANSGLFLFLPNACLQKIVVFSGI